MSDIIQYVPFYDDTLAVVVDEATGKEYILPKPMVEIFGLSWAGQFAKLTKNQLFAKGIKKILIPSQRGEQETLLLERRLVHAWLLSISVERVLREKPWAREADPENTTLPAPFDFD